MRGQYNIGERAEFAVLRERLFFENIQTGRSNFAGLECGDEGRFLDNSAASTVEDSEAWLALRERRFVDHVVRVVRHRHVHRNIVGLGEEFIQRDALDLHGLGAARGQIGVVGEYLHAERLRAFRHFRPDATETDHAEGFLEQFDAGKVLPIPLTGLHRSRGLGHGPRATKDVRKRQLGRRDGIARRGVHHNHATLGGGLDIDVVHADAGTANNLEQRRGGKNRGGNLRFRAHRDRMHVLDQFQYLLRRRAVSLNDFNARLLTQVGDSFG